VGFADVGGVVERTAEFGALEESEVLVLGRGEEMAGMEVEDGMEGSLEAAWRKATTLTSEAEEEEEGKPVGVEEEEVRTSSQDGGEVPAVAVIDEEHPPISEESPMVNEGELLPVAVDDDVVPPADENVLKLQ
jgi:hypothetical protein